MLSKKEFTQRLAKRIKELREAKGISQEELADRAGLYRTYIGHIENARYSPSSYVVYEKYLENFTNQQTEFNQNYKKEQNDKFNEINAKIGGIEKQIKK